MFRIDSISRITLVAAVALMSATPCHAYLSLGPSQATQPTIEQPGTGPAASETPPPAIEPSNNAPAPSSQAAIEPAKSVPDASEAPPSAVKQPNTGLGPSETPQAAIEPSNTEVGPSETPPSAVTRPNGNAPKHTVARPAPAPAPVHPHQAETIRRAPPPATSRYTPVGGLAN